MTFVNVANLSDLDEARLGKLLSRRMDDAPEVVALCRTIVEDVRRDGDRAVLAMTARFDGVELTADRLRVSADEFDRAEKDVPADMKDAVKRVVRNIRTFHAPQLRRGDRWLEVERGVWCGERLTPIDAVCLYVPRGRGSFSSVACMLGVPAVLAGVPRLIICTPPGPDGTVDAATLYAARLLGIGEVYRVGGAQAVAAVAYGTQTIPRCDKIVGPGNAYVSAARRLLADVIDPGPPAGPSESLLICDESADAENAAWNLMIEAEHGENSTAVLLTHVAELGRLVADAVGRCVGELTPDRRAFVQEVLARRGGVLVTKSLDESIEFANRFAAEHVALMVADPWTVLPLLTNAGEILFGDFPIISLANYAMGINAVLPTGGWARTASGVSVHDFLKRTAMGFVTADGLAGLRKTVPVMSMDEGFSAHHQALLRWRVER
ncbi:MAG: histidinol dehydrogenase [Phycisphaerae bacterium]